MKYQPYKKSGGFTLVELLAVIGVIILVMGGFGIAMKDGNPTGAMNSAATTLASLVSGTRAQAALTGKEAMLLINKNSNNMDAYLRYCVIAKKDGNNWVAVDGGYTLPKGVYIMDFGAGSSTSDALVEKQGLKVSGRSDNWLALEINAFGQATRPGKVLVSPGEREGDGTSIRRNTDNIQGVWVSKYGVATFIRSKEEAAGAGK